jgi:hypothetical protein
MTIAHFTPQGVSLTPTILQARADFPEGVSKNHDKNDDRH